MEQCREIVHSGLQQLKLPLDENKLESLMVFIALIEKWNKAYNLTAVRQREEMARLHILDSLVVLPYIEGKRVADIGTGAGLPGIPLAIYLPDVEFVLIDSNSKKTRFVQQAVLELQLKNVKVIHGRVESISIDPLFSTVIMRAFSKLQDIIHLTKHLLETQGFLLAMKGQQPDQELIDITAPYKIIPLHVPGVNAERCLIQIQGIAENG